MIAASRSRNDALKMEMPPACPEICCRRFEK